MAEQLVNEFTVNLPIDEAWKVLTDIERIAPCLPGAQLQEIEGDIYRGVVKIKLGSIAPAFKGQATFATRDDSTHRATLKAEGRDTGGRGNASATIVANATSTSPSSTVVVVTTDLHIAGKVAQFGRGIIGEVSKKLMAQFSTNLEAMLANDPEGHATTGAATDPPVDGRRDRSTDPSGARPTEFEADGTATSRPNGPRSAQAHQHAAPTVRRLNGPANDPLDLSDLAGPAMLRRIIPVLALVALLSVIRRRQR